VQFVWARPVYLETVSDGAPSLLSFDGSEHTMQGIGGTDDANRKPSAKAK
jgi:stage V sporulation protein R